MKQIDCIDCNTQISCMREFNDEIFYCDGISLVMPYKHVIIPQGPLINRDNHILDMHIVDRWNILIATA